MHPLRSSDVLVFDATGSDVLALTALAGIGHSVLPSRAERIHVSPGIVVRAIANAVRWGGRDLLRPRRLASVLYRSWLLACVQRARPRAVVTFVDNSFPFQWVSRRYPRARFFAVQNGARYRHDVSTWLPPRPLPGSDISMPDLLCWGTFEPELYARYGHHVDRFHPVGSLRGARYREMNPAPPAEAAFDVCLVSQWTDASGSRIFPEIDRGARRITEYVGRYVTEHPLRLCVALRSSDPDEAGFFRSQLGNAAELVAYDPAAMSTYGAMDRSEVVVTFCSSAATEAFGWGSKVLCVNLSGDDNYDFPRLGPWALPESTYEEFGRALDALRGAPLDPYLRESAEARAYTMAYDMACPPDRYLRRLVLDAVGMADTPAEEGR
jgi:hypothetical protein